MERAGRCCLRSQISQRVAVNLQQRDNAGKGAQPGSVRAPTVKVHMRGTLVPPVAGRSNGSFLNTSLQDSQAPDGHGAHGDCADRSRTKSKGADRDGPDV